jgi:hypothetical protein
MAVPNKPPIRKQKNIVFLVPILFETIPEIKHEDASEMQDMITFVKISPGMYLIYSPII